MALSKKVREQVWNKYNCRCAYCGEQIELKKMQVDHIIPKSDFIYHVKNKIWIPDFLKHLTPIDVDNIDNLNPACQVCNNWKRSHVLEVFRNELHEQIKRLNLYSSNYRIAKKYGLLEETLKPVVFYFEKIINKEA